ncbi:phytanoyl-CoA dioxygenase family protein [Hydrogenophaga sp. BPS33]|uniref:phytanoyl-CoA dioxygenase family protein n=1 Tax=Hydrogenophaga sp. BPS33 TaxID=2651974 RepID=UPI0013569217|nr:phytanoyl-CoA dioxygenase family protein [Hydrogenophaga sp. BPS33]
MTTTHAETPIRDTSRDAHLAATYAERGWIQLPNLVGAGELATIRALIEEADRGGRFSVPKTGVQADQALPEYHKTMRVLRRLWTDYPEVEALCRRIGRLVGDVTGWSSTRLWSDRVFIKPGKKVGSRPTIWHQDLPKIPIDRRGFTTVWITLSDLPATKGAMTFLNGSHHLGPLGATAQLGGESDLSELLREQDWNLVSGCTTAAPLVAGDATMHAGLTLHRAQANVEEEDRVVLAISYVDGNALYTGGANPVTDNLGMAPYKRMEHATMPIVA